MPKIKQFKGFKYKDLLGIMVKIQDENLGKVNGDGRFEKTPTAEDIRKLDEGAGMAKEILMEAGIREKDIIFTGPRAAHPGGSAAIGEVVDKNLETEIKNLFVCDASVLPKSSGAPPIVTIIALAKRLSAYMDMDERGSSW
jgi:choline dehydrogenase-like flavoprotein